jgi:hypothetical protein
MMYVSRKLGHKVEMLKLPRWASVPLLVEGVGDRLMVGEDDEVARFQHVIEMVYGLVNDQQLAVVCAVFLLGRIEFFGGGGEGLPGVLDSLLQNGTHGGRGGGCDQC